MRMWEVPTSCVPYTCLTHVWLPQAEEGSPGTGIIGGCFRAPCKNSQRPQLLGYLSSPDFSFKRICIRVSPYASTCMGRGYLKGQRMSRRAELRAVVSCLTGSKLISSGRTGNVHLTTELSVLPSPWVVQIVFPYFISLGKTYG